MRMIWLCVARIMSGVSPLTVLAVPTGVSADDEAEARRLFQQAAEARGADSSVLPLVGALMLSIHSFLAGAAFGTSSTAAVTLVIFVAVLAHKGAASFALSLELVQSGLAPATCLTVFAVFVALSAPAQDLGFVLAVFVIGKFKEDQAHDRSRIFAGAQVRTVAADGICDDDAIVADAVVVPSTPPIR